ncbi:Glycerol kinase [Planctomycetes bacterium Pan216]|uniref:Glycerol kinase n=1 Tax=Kolteria novifilia TaxID=2527975 RepID=A0A518BBV3_9BACT|nr:Glycerol kinase [Planctomycetes bacterium Pan216]
MGKYVLALDQGTTSSRAILFDKQGQPVAVSQREFPQIYPRPGSVEHDPEDIWSSQLETARDVLEKAGASADDIAALGIANQRETTVLWDKTTGIPVANAIVWQSRVSDPICRRLKQEGCEPTIREKTGLVVDPYLAGTKITHLLETVPGLRRRAEAGSVLFGTIDSYLLWRLTGGACHATDYSNASRTLLFNIHSLGWDDELLQMLDVPRAVLPEVLPSSHVYGSTAPELFGKPIPVAGMAGDQQAATFGQACFDCGDAKNTYGTGCFLLVNTGERPVTSHANLLTTIGWHLDGKVTYCLEGSVFIAGAVVQWLRDGLKVIESSSEVERLAATVSDSGGVCFVPAFVGLGAPHWDSSARGTIVGITRDTTAGHLARAALEAIAFRSRELALAMQKDADLSLENLKVDGGASANDLLMQFQSDILGVPIVRASVAETTALGAAQLAGLAVGMWGDTEELRRIWKAERTFNPAMDSDERERRFGIWKKAVGRSMDWAED